MKKGKQSSTSRPDILTQSGNYFDFIRPEGSVLEIDDIAHALSNICRFGGHCRQFYSVAQHSVLVSYIVPKEFSYVGLMHDCAEAVLGDIPRPLKALLPDYQALEKHIESVLFEKFEIPFPLPAQVKEADRIALATEQRDLMPAHNDSWPVIEGISPMEEKIFPVHPQVAFELFISRWIFLSETREHRTEEECDCDVQD